MKNTFKSKKEAIEFLKNCSKLNEHRDGITFSRKGVYVCAHGEYSRPEFSVARYKNGWAIKIEHFFYSGTFHIPNDGRLLNDEFSYIFDNSY